MHKKAHLWGVLGGVLGSVLKNSLFWLITSPTKGGRKGGRATLALQAYAFTRGGSAWHSNHGSCLITTVSPLLHADNTIYRKILWDCSLNVCCILLNQRPIDSVPYTAFSCHTMIGRILHASLDTCASNLDHARA